MAGLELLINIGGGVALLLWATRTVRTGIERAYGDNLRRVLALAARSRGSAFATGLGVAGALQSSTATALLTVSCVAAGMLQTAPALAVMLGADVGSTLVVQALSFDIVWLSPALLLIGVTLFLSSERRKPRQLGRIILGLGLMLLSLQLIVAASSPLRDSATLTTLVGALGSEPALAVLLAAVLTALAHSSVAVVLLIMSLAATGLVPLPLGFALVLGANLGSGLIPLLLTWRQPAPARRVPLGNFLFRAAGALLALLALTLLAPLLARLGDDGSAARQIANFHTLFNLLLALLFLPLTAATARLTERLLPERPDAAADPMPLENPSHLDPTLTADPKPALACATREVLRMADRVEAMLRYALDTFKHEDKTQAVRLGKIDDQVDRMHTSIKQYLTEISRHELSEADSRRCMEITTFTIKLEHIGDIVEKNLLASARKKIKNRQDFSEQGWQELTDMHASVLDNMLLALNVFVSGDRDSARRLIEAKERFRRLEYRNNKRHLKRLRAGKTASIETSAIHLDVVRDLKQINSLLASAAYPILHDAGELLQSRLVAPESVEEITSDED